MFLKRVLVVMVGVLLFIGAFLLKYRLSDEHIENVFKQEREQFGVAGSVLTAPASELPTLTVPPPAIIPAAATTSAAETPSSGSSSSPDASSSDATPPPGSTTDTNVIIGPLPPGANPQPDQAPFPAPDPVPAPDTNSGPMVPIPSTMTLPRTRHDAPLMGMGGRTLRLALQVAMLQTAQATNLDRGAEAGTNPSPSTRITNGLDTPPATNSTGEMAQPRHEAAPAISSPAHPTYGAGRAIVLGYHQFTGPGVPSKNIYSMSQDVFESEMKYLKDNGYNVVPLSDVVKFVEHKGELPQNAVAITIDDGYKSSIVWAGPILKKYGFPWTYFVYPAFITRTEGKGAASWPDLVELDKEGVDVECHSMTHPILTSRRQKFKGPTHALSPQEYDDFLTEETSAAKAVLEHELGKPIKYFAYPYGAYNKAVEAKAIAAGFEAIFTVADNPVHVTTDVFRIGRYIITKPVERAFAGYLRQGALSLAKVDPEPGETTSDPRPVISAVLGFTGDPASIETEVRDFGSVRHDFDPQTSTIRLYLPRDLIQPEVLVSVRAKDAQSGQTMVANWQFNYEPSGVAEPAHQPISSGATNTKLLPLNPPSTAASATNSPTTTPPPAAMSSTLGTNAAATPPTTNP